MDNKFKPLGSLPSDHRDGDAHEPYYKDTKGMMLSHYVMAERCMQVEAYKIYNDYLERDYSTLSYILEGGFRGFHKMSRQDLEAEYKDCEETWYELESGGILHWEAYEEDPIHKLEGVTQ